MPRTIFITIAFMLAAASAQADATFRGDLAHSGVYAASAVAAAPKLAWQFHGKGRFIASPALSGGVVYDGATDGFLYAVDAASGALKWKFRTGARIAASPAVARGLVYTESYDGNFYAVDVASGTLKWKFATGGERRFAARHLHGMLPETETMPDPFDFYLSSPAVSDGTVFFGSGDGNVYALDAASGALKWKFATGDVVHASPALAGGTLYIGSWDTYFYAIDAATGKEKWRFKTGDDAENHNQTGIQSSAAVVDGAVYFGCRDSNLYALDAATGRKLWAYNNKGSWVIASPAVKDGKVYASTADTGRFFALDAKTGAELFALDFKHWPMFSSPALAGGTAYIGSHSGKLIAIDLAGRAVAWQFQTDGARNAPASDTAPDGTPNYDAVFSENFYDDIVAGTDHLMRRAILSSPVVGDGKVIFGSNDGNLYAVKG